MDNLPVINEINFDLIMTLTSQGLWHIYEQIFAYLNYETVENCRKVSQLWNMSLERIALVKCLEEFGDRNVVYKNKSVSTIFPGWPKVAKKYGVQARIEDLRKVKCSLKNLARGNDKCCEYPVHEAARNGAVKLIKLILKTSFDMNTKNDVGSTALHLACMYGRTETAQLIIQYSKDFVIDLNATDNFGITAWHLACCQGRTETVQLMIKNSKDFGIDLNVKENSGMTALHFASHYRKTEIVQMILKNWKEFGIEIKAKRNDGKTALDIINHRGYGNYPQIKKMLEKYGLIAL